MLPQPPPDAPAPPPSVAALRLQTKWKWMVGVGMVCMLGFIVVLLLPLTLRSRKKSDQTEAVNNARQVGLASFEFQSEFGSFPNAATVPEVNKKSGASVLLEVKTSNDHFRQLIASEIAQSEAMFNAKITNSREPAGPI